MIPPPDDELIARLYLDEDVSVQVAKLLRARGHDVVTTVEAHRLGATDRSQLEFSTSERRVLVTHNRRDFEALAAFCFENQTTHAGLIIAVRRPPKLIVERVAQMLDSLSGDEMRDRTLYI